MPGVFILYADYTKWIQTSDSIEMRTNSVVMLAFYSIVNMSIKYLGWESTLGIFETVYR